ncbi:MAG: hypothetical protein Q7T04_01175, partial [Dehalococcoidia bacterium]|nr:hypothetical protein [Dehalococcoidia bacterium]
MNLTSPCLSKLRTDLAFKSLRFSAALLLLSASLLAALALPSTASGVEQPPPFLLKWGYHSA